MRSGTINKGYLVFDIDGKKRFAHVLIAEAALGHALPPGAEVHHWNENKLDNRPENLVICPDAAYHRLLHRRARALDACGHANWRRCVFCKEYDDPTKMQEKPQNRHFFHVECKRRYERELYARPKQ